MRAAVLAVSIAGCGQVNATPTDATSRDAPDQTPPKTFHALLDATPATPFGGDPYCKYTITLKQLDVAISVKASGQVESATIQDLNVEAVVPPCPYGPADPSIAKYSLDAAKPISGGTQLTFKGDATNAPAVMLTVDLQPLATLYMAKLAFLRTDQQPPLAWNVAVMMTLSPQ